MNNKNKECFICYKTFTLINRYTLNCCKQSMCNDCLYRLKKTECPLCRKAFIRKLKKDNNDDYYPYMPYYTPLHIFY